MTDIQVTDAGPAYQVEIREGGSSTSHRVTVSDDLYRRLTAEKMTRPDCIRAAFRFLLEREPKESILSTFDLSVISRYFPEFEKRFKDYTTA